MAHAHLAEVHAVGGAFDAEVILPAGEAVPHGLHLGRYRRCGPVGVAVVCGHTTKVLELLVLEFHRTFEPIVTIQVHHYTALVEALVALREIRLHHEAEELLPGLHLQNGGVIVPEMIIGPLP